MRATFICFFLNAMLIAGSASAYDAYDPKNCNGAEADDKLVMAVARVTAKPRAYFVKSPYDDDFKAENCPAAGPDCVKKSYLVTGDLVLVGKTRDEFTCISFQSPLATKQIWAHGWLPTAALEPVTPMASPKMSDWIGTWYHPGGPIEIKRGKGGKLEIEGGMTVPTARDFHNGSFHAEATPEGNAIALEDDGSNYGSGCHVRLQRIGPWLLVVDDSGCGGAAVSFTGLYRRKN